MKFPDYSQPNRTKTNSFIAPFDCYAIVYNLPDFARVFINSQAISLSNYMKDGALTLVLKASDTVSTDYQLIDITYYPLSR